MREPELPGELGKVFVEIENQVIALHAEWGVWRQLFEHEGDWRLLVQTSAYGWPVLHDALVERCILRMARLTDRAATHNSPEKQNLSFAYLRSVLKSEGHDELSRLLTMKLDEMKDLAHPLIALRHKVLAHADLEVSLGKREYPNVTINRISDLVPRVADFCQAIRVHCGLVHFYYDWCVGAWARGIVDSLQKLQRFNELRDRIRNMEVLDVYQLRQAVLEAGREQA
ncbi:MAG: hypothetical protein WD669_09325 [Pirellulales bacterium]